MWARILSRGGLATSWRPIGNLIGNRPRIHNPPHTKCENAPAGYSNAWAFSPFRHDPYAYFRYFVNDYVMAGPIYHAAPGSEWMVAALAKT